jgi:hypothetical protein
MTFNIGSQQAGQINNVQGDQHIAGGQHAVFGTDAVARQAARDLRRALAEATIDRRNAAGARRELDEIDAGLGAARPDRHRVAGALERLTRLLSSAGALVTAGAALVEPLRALAGWLGGLGAPVLQLLG